MKKIAFVLLLVSMSVYAGSSAKSRKPTSVESLPKCDMTKTTQTAVEIYFFSGAKVGGTLITFVGFGTAVDDAYMAALQACNVAKFLATDCFDADYASSADRNLTAKYKNAISKKLGCQYVTN